MASHTFHDDIAEHGLADGCDRCAEHAAHPATLDDQNLGALWHRMLDVEFGYNHGDVSYRSDNEAKAGKYLYDVAVLLERFGVSPFMLREQVRAHLRSVPA
jgi:hypothetical protein